MANDLRVEIIGDGSSLRRALLAAVAELDTAASAMKKHNANIVQDTEKTGKKIKTAWYDAERGLFNFRKASEVVASAVATERTGPINSLTRGIGNVIFATGAMGNEMQKVVRDILPVADNAEKAGGALESMGLSASALAPVIGALVGVVSTLAAALVVLPAVTAGVVAVFVALLDTVTILSAGLLALAAPVTVVTGLLGALGLAFGFVAVQSIKNKATLQDVHDNLLKVHVAQQTYNEDVAKYGKNATQTENALLALHKAQDAYEMSQLGVALGTAKLQDKFHELIQTLAGRFAPALRVLVGAASDALSYLTKIAQLPLAQAFKDLATTGVTGVTGMIQKIGFMLAKPFKLAIKFGFGTGEETLSSQVKSLYNELTNYLVGPGGALNPIVAWFHRQDFTETGLRWSHEIIAGIIGLWNRDSAFRNSVLTVLSDAGKAGGQAFVKVLKWEISSLYNWLKSSGVGAWAAFASVAIIALSPVITAVRNLIGVLKLMWVGLGKIITLFTEVALGMETTTVATTEAAAAMTEEAVSAQAAAIATAEAGAAAAGASAEESALAVASLEAAAGLDAAALSAEGAGVAAEAAAGAGGLAALGLSLTGIVATAAAVVGGIYAIYHVWRGGSIGPFAKTTSPVTALAPVVKDQAGSARQAAAAQRILADSARTVASQFDAARTAADRLFAAEHHLTDTKLTLKGDKIQLQFDQNAVKEAHANLQRVLNDPSAKPYEITGARLQLKQAKFQVESDKKITLPMDKAQIAAAAAYVQKQTDKIVASYQHAFDVIQSHNLFDTKAMNLARFHGAMIKAAGDTEAYANKVRKSNPVLASFKDHIAAVGIVTDILTQKIGHVPTTKQINIYLKNHPANVISIVQELGASIDHLVSKSLSINTYFHEYHTRSGPGGAPREAGGSVVAGAPYTVGERGQELFVPGASGAILPAALTKQLLAMAGAPTGTRPGLPGSGSGSGDDKGSSKQEQGLKGVLHQIWRFLAPKFWPRYEEPPITMRKHLQSPYGHTEVGGVSYRFPNRHIFLDPYYMAWLAQKMPLDKKYWLSAYDDVHLAVHEFAHTEQNRDTWNTVWQREGGAEAFADALAPSVMAALGMPGHYSRQPTGYNAYVSRVLGMQDPMWLTFGQFGHRGYHTMSNREKQLREFHIPEMFRHDYGGNAWAGQVSLVGGSGPELRYETSNARYMPAQDTARGGGGSVEMHFHFPNAAIVDGRTVEQAARLVKPALDRLAGRR